MNLDTVRSWMEDPLFSRLANLAFLLVIVLIVGRIVRASITSRIADSKIRYRVRKGISVAIWVLAAFVIASSLSDRLKGLGVVFGVAGAGVAFALQEVIASLAGRVAILFASFYNVGDRVQLGGIKGDVVDIGTLRTTIMEVGDWVKGDLYTGRVVRVANSFVFKEPVFNYSGDFAFLWDEITIPVKYGCDRKLARAMLDRVVTEVTADFVKEAKGSWKKMTKQFAIEQARIEPMVTLIANDNWLEYTVRYVVPYTKRRTVKDVLFERIMDEVDASEGRVAMASATFHLVESPVFDVRLLPPPEAVKTAA